MNSWSEKSSPLQLQYRIEGNRVIYNPVPSLVDKIFHQGGQLFHKETEQEKAIREFHESSEIMAALVRRFRQDPVRWDERAMHPSPPSAFLEGKAYQDAIVKYYVETNHWGVLNTSRLISNFLDYKWIPGWDKVVDKASWSFFPKIRFIKTEKKDEIIYEAKMEQAELQVEVAKALGVGQVAEFEKEHSFKEGDEVRKDRIGIVTKDGVAIDCVADSYYGNEPIEPYLVKEWINRAKTRFISDTYTGKTYREVMIVVSDDLDFEKLRKAFKTEMRKPEFREFSGKIELLNLSGLKDKFA